MMQPNEIMLRLTGPMQNYIQNYPEKEQNMLEMIDSLRVDINNNLKKGATKEALMEFLINLFDLEHKKVVHKTDAPISCTKGCSFCCRINVNMSELEARLILKTIKERKISVERSLLESQLGLTDDERVLSISPCVFLSSKGECNIYDVRPLACRKYFVVSDPSLCNTYNNPGAQPSVSTYFILEAITSAIYSSNVIFGSMSELLLKEMDM